LFTIARIFTKINYNFKLCPSIMLLSIIQKKIGSLVGK
jgi:hypothetical protein